MGYVGRAEGTENNVLIIPMCALCLCGEYDPQANRAHTLWAGLSSPANPIRAQPRRNNSFVPTGLSTSVVRFPALKRRATLAASLRDACAQAHATPRNTSDEIFRSADARGKGSRMKRSPQISRSNTRGQKIYSMTVIAAVALP